MKLSTIFAVLAAAILVLLYSITSEDSQLPKALAFIAVDTDSRPLAPPDPLPTKRQQTLSASRETGNVGPVTTTSRANPKQALQQLLTANQILVKTGDEELLGRRVASDNRQLFLMLPSGHMRHLLWQEVVEALPVSQPFMATDTTVLRQQLQNEFGPAFRVDQSRDFLVVRPVSSRQPWLNRMQQFLGNTQTYFSMRQFPMSASPFPLVTVVFPNRQEWLAYAQRQQEPVTSGYVAYYSVYSNRVLLYESDSTEQNLSTILHEAFHQIAFNCGLHYRSATPPRWVAEGMATAFEAPGMYDHRRSSTRSDRLHSYYHRTLPTYLDQAQLEGDLKRLLQSDDLFATEPDKAYCLSWAMAFYFMEFVPQRFAAYLESAHSPRPFRNYSTDLRLQHFQRLHPNGTRDLADRLKQFFTQP